MSDTVIAAQMYTLREFTRTPADIAATLARVKAIGYDAIQISRFGQCDPAEIARILDGEGLVCASTHVDWRRLTDQIDQVIAEHRLWGCRFPALGGMPGEYRNPDGVAEFARRADDIGARFAQDDMEFSYHNHNFELQRIGEKTWLEVIFATADPAHLKAEIDTYWIQAGGGDPAQWVRKYADRMPVLHLKDMAMGPEKNEQRMAPIGAGNMNFEAILAAARDGSVRWYCVEQDKCYEDDPFECLRTSLDNLHAMGLK